MSRYVLVRHDGQEHLLLESAFPTEANLHDAFANHPELFPTEELNCGQVLVAGREVKFESGKADLVCLDEGGQIIIVEFKKGIENPDSRHVVAQMLDYGAHLWKMSFDDFETTIALPYLQKHWKSSSPVPSSLREAALLTFDLESNEGGVEKFASELTRHLSDGSFLYIVVARTFPSGLGKVLAYLGEVSRVQAAAVAVDYFQEGDRQILVPRVVVAASGEGPKPPPPSKTNPARFLAEVGTDTASWWESLLNFLESLPGRFYWGEKGFSYRIVWGGKQYSVLWGYPRTVWWLKDKNLGEELSIVVVPNAGWPEDLQSLVKSVLTPIGEHPRATILGGSAPYARFYVKPDNIDSFDSLVRNALARLFGGGS
jgi:hypothetical protein